MCCRQKTTQELLRYPADTPILYGGAFLNFAVSTSSCICLSWSARLVWPAQSIEDAAVIMQMAAPNRNDLTLH